MTLYVEDNFPKNGNVTKNNKIVNKSIEGDGNFVDPSAINVVCFGEANSIGSNVKNSEIFNSSGCIINSGLKNVCIINSSGVIATEDDVVYVYNSRVPAIRASYKITTVNSTNIDQIYYYATSDDECMLIDSTDGAWTIRLLSASLPSMYRNGYGKLINIKKIDSTGNIVTIQASNSYIDGEQYIQLTQQYESVTLISDGTNYNII